MDIVLVYLLLNLYKNVYSEFTILPKVNVLVFVNKTLYNHPDRCWQGILVY